MADIFTVRLSVCNVYEVWSHSAINNYFQWSTTNFVKEVLVRWILAFHNRLSRVFHPVFWCHDFHSRVFHSCFFWRSRVFHSRVFSRPATTCLNLVHFGPVTSEFKISKNAHASFLSFVCTPAHEILTRALISVGATVSRSGCYLWYLASYVTRQWWAGINFRFFTRRNMLSKRAGLQSARPIVWIPANYFSSPVPKSEP